MIEMPEMHGNNELGKIISIPLFRGQHHTPLHTTTTALYRLHNKGPTPAWYRSSFVNSERVKVLLG